MSTIVLPDLGEGVDSGIVTSIVVKPGDSVNDGDTLIEIETDKAVLPVPANTSGTISEVLIKEGDKIDVGQDLFKLDGAAASNEESSSYSDAAPAAEAESPAPAAVSSENRTVNLPDLGEGVSGGIVTALSVSAGDEVAEGEALIEIETDKAVLPVPSPVSGKVNSLSVQAGDKISVGDAIAEMTVTGGVAEAAAPAPTVSAPKSEAPAKKPAVKAASSAPTPVANKSGKVVPAGPATRKLARELGLDLSDVEGSKRGGRVSVEDLKRYVKSMNLKGSAPSAGGGATAPAANWEPLPDFSKFGPVKKEKVSNLRNIISNRMSMCWNRIPHVFQFDEVDFSKIADIQKRYKDDFKARGSSVSPTNFIIKAMAICLSEFPQFNSSFDEGSGEVIYKDYINIGVAVDTPTGLIVPVLKGVDKMTIFDIGKELKELAQRTRDRKVTPDDLAGGCMTLSNLGGIGGTHFTPIVNWPEVAILGVGKGTIKPVYVDGEFVPRMMTQLTLSYDHRVIDGADGARFMVRLSDILQDIERTLLGG
jgi:pyruvate dehydrogenase E2 component (dihydrolipoamide acetyltransferase)